MIVENAKIHTSSKFPSFTNPTTTKYICIIYKYLIINYISVYQYFHIMKNTYINIFFIICSITFFILNPRLFSQGKYPIQNFPPSNYKGGIQNIDFAQNRSMALFVANNLGILSYNGHDWDLHTFEQGKKKRSLAFDRDNNRLYVGLQGEFGYLTDDWEYISLAALIPEGAKDFDEVWDVFCIDSKIYFCTFQNIFIYDGQSIRVVSNAEGFNRSFSHDHKLYTQNDKGELLELKGNQFIKKEMNLKGNDIVSGLITYDEKLYVFYQSGKILPYNPNNDSKLLSPLSNSLKGTYINHVLQLSDTRLAISTQTSGLYLYDIQSQSIEQIDIDDGLLSNACLRSFQDFSGNLWVGMQNGIAVIDINSPMRLMSEEIKIQGSGYEAYEAKEGTYYTTSNGIYYKDKASKHCIFLEGTEGPAYGIRDIKGKIYAGHNNGLFLLDKNKIRHILKTEGVWDIKLLKANPQYAICGTYFGMHLLRFNTKNELEPVSKLTGFNESSRFFEEDKKGNIWVSQFYKGLFKLEFTNGFKSVNVKKIPEESDIPIGEQVTISSIDNEIYFSTQEGIYYLNQNNQKIEPAEMFEKKIGKQTVYLLKQDKRKNIYVYAQNLFGIYKQISSDNYAFTSSSLHQLRYFFNNDLLHLSVHTNNGIMINSNDGFIRYMPEKEKRIENNIPLMTSQMTSVVQNRVLYYKSVFEKEPVNTTPIKLSHRDNFIQFKVESFQFKNANNQEFQYYLKGFDEDYGAWTSATIKEYTNLKEGDYSFTVRTKNSFNDYSESEPIQFTISPPWHRSLIAKICYFLIGLIALYGIAIYYKKDFEKKSMHLEKEKQEQLTKNKIALDEIEKQNELNLLKLREEKMHSELIHLNKLLAASTMNLVVKNEFINSIKIKLKEIKNNIRNTTARQSLIKLEKEIGNTLELQEDWEQFKYHFNQVHGDFLTRIRTEFNDLSANDQKLCAFLRLNLNTKEISNIMCISLRGVEIARYRLRKKLNLNTGENLSKFILNY